MDALFHFVIAHFNGANLPAGVFGITLIIGNGTWRIGRIIEQHFIGAALGAAGDNARAFFQYQQDIFDSADFQIIL